MSLQTLYKKEWQRIFILLGIYVFGFFMYYPTNIVNMDEMRYLLQAKNFSEGKIYSQRIDPFTGKQDDILPSTYPAGTSLLLTPFYAIGRLKGAYLFPLLMLIATVLLTAKWIAEQGRSPLFALFVLGYLPTLVLGRSPMSDLPSAFIVTLGYWLFWKGQKGSRYYWFFSGCVAGLSLLFREPNILLFIILFLGAFFRREQNTYLLLLGLLFGGGVRLLSSFFLYGSFWFYKTVLPGFGMNMFANNLTLYAIALLLFIPGGLVGVFAYKGERRLELIGTGIVFFFFHVCYQYAGETSGLVRSLILGPRYFIPLSPIIAFQMAESFPRLWDRVSLKFKHRQLFSRRQHVGISLWLIALGLGAFGVHWGSHWYFQQAVNIQAEYQAFIPAQSLVIGNRFSMKKYMNELYGNYQFLDFRKIQNDDLAHLTTRYSDVFIVFLERAAHSVFWQKEAQLEETFLASLTIEPQLLLDKPLLGGYHLTIRKITNTSLQTEDTL